jgi:hypothetical protein
MLWRLRLIRGVAGHDQAMSGSHEVDRPRQRPRQRGSDSICLCLFWIRQFANIKDHPTFGQRHGDARLLWNYERA